MSWFATKKDIDKLEPLAGGEIDDDGNVRTWKMIRGQKIYDEEDAQDDNPVDTDEVEQVDTNYDDEKDFDESEEL